MDRSRFYASVRARASGVFGTSLSQGQVEKVEAVLDGVEKARVSLEQAAYILGTGYHESDRYRVMDEYANGKAYEGRADLGNVYPGDGVKFKGRGLVMITGRRNYADWSGRLGIDLIGHPELAGTLKVAVPVLIQGMMKGTFTGKKLPDYINASQCDYVTARRVVNGMDKASLIAGYAKAFETALREAGYERAAPAPAREDPSAGADPRPSAPGTVAVGKDHAIGVLIGAAVTAAIVAVATWAGDLWHTIIGALS